MLAAVYSSKDTEGVRVTTVPLPLVPGVRLVSSYVSSSSVPCLSLSQRIASRLFYVTPSRWSSLKLGILHSLVVLIRNIYLVLYRLFALCFSSSSSLTSSKAKVRGGYAVCKVIAAGVNPVDAKHLYGDKAPHFLLPFVKWVVEGRICGIDFAGVVLDIHYDDHEDDKKKSKHDENDADNDHDDDADDALVVGDEVYGTVPPLTGSFTEFVRVPLHQIARRPKNITIQQAAALPLVSLTAYQSLSDVGVGSGWRVLVLGASGGTGHMVTQMAKAKGAHVTAVCGTPNIDFVKEMGADEIVDYHQGDVIDALGSLVSRFGPFDFVFDSVSSHDPRDSAFDYEHRIRGFKLAAPYQSSLLASSSSSSSSSSPSSLSPSSSLSSNSLLSPRCSYVFIGGQPYDWLLAHIKRFAHINLFKPGRQLFWVRFPHSSGALSRIRALVESGHLSSVLKATFPLTSDGVQEAFQMQMGRRTVGKIVIQVEPIEAKSK